MGDSLTKFLWYNTTSLLERSHQLITMLKDRNAFHANQTGVLHRHGDVMIQRIDRLPSQAQHRDGATLAHGEVTGHSHRFAQPDTVQLWEQGRNLFVDVIAPVAALVHEEHHQIDLPQGFYRFWKQREYRPDAYVDVED
jgi:chloramphenicol 3-O-phosphotransferase